MTTRSRVTSGDRQFEALFWRTSNRLRRFCVLWGGLSPAEADDVIQDTFLSYFLAARYQRIRSPGGWLRGALVRKLAHFARSRQRARWVHGLPEETALHSVLPGQEHVSRWLELLRSITSSREQEALFALASGRSTTEVAQLLVGSQFTSAGAYWVGKARATAKQYLSHGRDE